MFMQREQHSVPMSLSDCIDALGGTAAVARACRVSNTAVSNWRAAGAVPARHAIRVWAMARRAGLTWRPPGTEGCDLVVDEAHGIQPAEAPMFTQCSRKEAAA
jgi:hypothetical protein